MVWQSAHVDSCIQSIVSTQVVTSRHYVSVAFAQSHVDGNHDVGQPTLFKMPRNVGE